ncbi:MAG TPA: hypothetical protein PKD09_18010 [Aggregatilinea sp.]|uniref:hypothetical protein n=1 Tax=Aggregatilinea sp. TaxID=2806333 RepID=UPI002B9E9B8E|nr:hypothetical protein [Aggregatilinea sp.]HML23557.1 hypothetical protein [Aggregatilinea sp.]
MNVDNGDLIELFGATPPPEGYIPIPPELNRAARRKLAGHSQATVSLTSGGKLSKWAAKQRKAKRKVAKDSRRKNRGK